MRRRAAAGPGVSEGLGRGSWRGAAMRAGCCAEGGGGWRALRRPAAAGDGSLRPPVTANPTQRLRRCGARSRIASSDSGSLKKAVGGGYLGRGKEEGGGKSQQSLSRRCAPSQAAACHSMPPTPRASSPLPGEAPGPTVPRRHHPPSSPLCHSPAPLHLNPPHLLPRCCCRTTVQHSPPTAGGSWQTATP